MQERKSPAPTFPGAEYVGEHLVIDKTELVPGAHPDPHLREDGQTTYPDRYFRCIHCGAERLRRRDLPAECDAPAPSAAGPDVVQSGGSDR